MYHNRSCCVLKRSRDRRTRRGRLINAIPFFSFCLSLLLLIANANARGCVGRGGFISAVNRRLDKTGNPARVSRYQRQLFAHAFRAQMPPFSRVGFPMSLGIRYLSVSWSEVLFVANAKREAPLSSSLPERENFLVSRDCSEKRTSEKPFLLSPYPYLRGCLKPYPCLPFGFLLAAG